jgi:hypothetical protein
MTYDQIYALAPDTDTLQKARGVSYAGRKWQMIEGNEKLLWANYQTAPSLIHKVVADLERNEFGCTCRSPQRPCRHALALLMLLLRHDERIRVTYDPPDWVLKWKSNQNRKAKPTNAGSPLAKQTERIASKRYLAMQEGVVELKQWLSNLVRQGLAVAKEQPLNFWDDFAARMVDAKLGSIGKQIRLAKSLLLEEDWHDRLLGLVADLHLFAQSFQQLDRLPDKFQDELISYAGVNVKKRPCARSKRSFRPLAYLGSDLRRGRKATLSKNLVIGRTKRPVCLITRFCFWAKCLRAAMASRRSPSRRYRLLSRQYSTTGIIEGFWVVPEGLSRVEWISLLGRFCPGICRSLG